MTPGELHELIRRLDEPAARLGVRDYLRLQAILDSPLATDRDTLRAALASALARNPQDWERIAKRFDECAGSSPALTPASGRQLMAALAAAPPPQRAWLRRRLLWVALAILAVTVAIAAAAWHHRPPPQPQKPQQQIVEKAPPPVPVDGVTIQPYAPSPADKLIQVPWQPPPRRESPWVLLAVAATSLLLSALGLRWLWLPGLRRTEQKAAATARRKELSEAQVRSKYPLRPLYRVPGVLPLEPGAVEDAATYLGRIFREERGQELDVPATLRLTLDAGGRFEPVFAPRRLSRELLVLIDYEKGDHPWLWGLLRILDEWQKRGVNLLRFRFSYQPGHLMWLRQHGEPDLLTLADLGRRHEGAAILVFSRRLSPRGDGDGEADWLAELSSWPLRAWLDPDPRPEAERSRAERRDLARVLGSGLRRFPFCAQGLVLLGRHFAAEGVGVAPPGWPALPKVAELAPQLELLATVAAMVPDPTWEQVEGFRRLLAEDLPGLAFPGYVQRLIEWLEQSGDEDPEQDVRTLCVAQDLVGKLLERLYAREGQGGQIGPLERRIRKLLLAEIAEDDEEGEPGELRRLLRELARARHLSFLEPDQAGKHLARFVGSPVENEARYYLEPELARLPDGGGPGVVRLLLGPGGAVPAWELWRGGWRLGWAGLALVWVAMWGSAWWFGLSRLVHAPGEQAQAILPRLREVVRPPPKLVSGSGQNHTADGKKRAPDRGKRAAVQKGDGRARGASTPEVVPGVAEVRGGLDRDIIGRVMNGHINEINHCYELAALGSLALAGRVVAHFTIASTGTVTSSVIQASTANSPSLEQCIATSIRRWQFPRWVGGGIVDVTRDFVFSPQKEDGSYNLKPDIFIIDQ